MVMSKDPGGEYPGCALPGIALFAFQVESASSIRRSRSQEASIDITDPLTVLLLPFQADKLAMVFVFSQEQAPPHRFPPFRPRFQPQGFRPLPVWNREFPQQQGWMNREVAGSPGMPVRGFGNGQVAHQVNAGWNDVQSRNVASRAASRVSHQGIYRC